MVAGGGMSKAQDPLPELAEVVGRVGARLVTAEPAGWGDAGATYRIDLADGRSMAARRIAGEGSAARADAMRRHMVWLGAGGVPVLTARTVDMNDASWLLTPWVDGAPGSTWLDDPQRARHLARQMGELAARIRELRPVETDLEALGWPDKPGASDAAPPSIVHGDFAPINVIVDPDGEIIALLDFEHAGPGPALLDVAWWGWVVRHHHPDAWEVAWPTFLVAAGLARGPIEFQLHELALQALDDRAAAAGDAETRCRWLDRRSAAERWSVPG